MSRQFNHRIDPLREEASPAEDELGRENFALEVTREILTNDFDTKIVGIYGSWGSGKTFLLDKIIDTIFANRERMSVTPVVAVFEAWRYEHEPSLIGPFLHTLRDLDSQFTGYKQNPSFALASKSWRAHASTLIGLVSRTGPAIATALEPLSGVPATAVTAGTTVMDAATERLSPSDNNGDISLPVAERFQSTMEALVEEVRSATKSPKTCRVIVMIDDLDRCAPDRLVEMLEWLKVHLSVPGISYVVALDQTAAARAIVGKYRTYLGDSADLSYGYRYLEKVVDVEYELGLSPSVERMASQLVFDEKYESVAEAVERITESKMSILDEATRLLALPDLRAPRTALKVVSRFERCIQIFARPANLEATSNFPPSWTSWLFILCAMYYRLTNEEMSSFVSGDSDLARGWGSQPQGIAGAQLDFAEFAAHWRNETGNRAEMLPPDALRLLANTVRQLVMPPV